MAHIMQKLIHQIPPSAKTTANSLSNCVQNLLGYLPAPYVYGLVQDLTGGDKSVWGLFAIECAGILAVVMLVSVWIKEKRETKELIAQGLLKKEQERLNKEVNQVHNILDYESSQNHSMSELGGSIIDPKDLILRPALEFDSSHPNDDSYHSPESGSSQRNIPRTYSHGNNSLHSFKTPPSEIIKQSITSLNPYQGIGLSINDMDHYSENEEEVPEDEEQTYIGEQGINKIKREATLKASKRVN
jgi:hypothetical protein